MTDPILPPYDGDVKRKHLVARASFGARTVEGTKTLFSIVLMVSLETPTIPAGCDRVSPVMPIATKEHYSTATQRLHFVGQKKRNDHEQVSDFTG
jgi:hypothetical protein